MPTRATNTKRTGTKRAATKKTRSTGTKRRTATRGGSHQSSHGRRKWSAGVNTESTYPQEGLFKKDAATIARSLASKKVSPKGPSSGMRMLTFYVNRAGKNLPKSRLRVLERAKELLHERLETMKGGTGRRSVTRSRGR
jgi:tRNA(adenine34) deaminase